MVREIERKLLYNIKKCLPQLKELLKKAKSDWYFEDHFYRFYHQSFKVYWLQGMTLEIQQNLKNLLPNRELHPFFVEIIRDGTDKKFDYSHNQRWTKETRPIIEASFHAIYFLEIAVHIGGTFEEPPEILPSDYAAFLELYSLR